MMRMRPPRVRRLVQLYAGLVLFGVSSSMLLLAGLGVDPWDVFHQGLSRRLGLGVGTWAIIVGVPVLLLWIPLRQKPGFGTLSNVLRRRPRDRRDARDSCPRSTASPPRSW